MNIIVTYQNKDVNIDRVYKMKKTVISTESTCDLSAELIAQYNVKVIPYRIQIGDRSFCDGEISTEELFDIADKNNVLPKTSAINEQEFLDYFTDLRREYDAVVHISLSGGITTATENAKRAAAQLDNVYVVDSLSLSTGMGLLVRYAHQLAEQGVTAPVIAELLTKRASKLQVSFVIERLDYLYKGGRCSSLQYLGANLLKLRPRIVMKDGKMSADKKYLGSMGRVVSKYCDDVLDEFGTPDLDCVFITYTTATPEMIAAAREACADVGFVNIFETHAGGTIASHCGAHTLGILYFNDGNSVESAEF